MLAKGFSRDTAFGVESFESGMVVVGFFDFDSGYFGFDSRFIGITTGYTADHCVVSCVVKGRS